MRASKSKQLSEIIAASSVAVQQWATLQEIEQPVDLAGYFTTKTDFAADPSLQELNAEERSEVQGGQYCTG